MTWPVIGVGRTEVKLPMVDTFAANKRPGNTSDWKDTAYSATIPLRALGTQYCILCACVAQLVEHSTDTRAVVSSNLTART